jgi:hypothetical protein
MEATPSAQLDIQLAFKLMFFTDVRPVHVP